MNRYATPVSCWSSASSATIWLCTETSSADTGSSATISFGPSTSAVAIPTRWRRPPESSCGRLRANREGSATRSIISATRARRSAGVPMPWISSGSRMMSSIRWRGSSDAYGSWKTTWISRRRRNQRSRDAPAMSSPSKRICARGRAQQPEHEPPQSRLARARLADDPERRPGLDRKRHAGDGVDRAARRRRGRAR